MKRKSLIRRLIPWIVALLLIAALVVFVFVPLYATSDTEAVNPPIISYYEGGSEPLTMENDDLLFEMDPTTTQFTVTEKATGRVWRSNPEGAASDPVALAANKDTLQSTLLVTYSSASGVIDFNNYANSIKNGSYTVEKTEDGTVRVVYAVGKIEKVYILPQAITTERMDLFTSKMSKSEAKKVKGIYTLIKPDKLDSRDDKDALLAMYPSLAEQELYILKSDTSTANKDKNAGYFEAAGYTMEDFEQDNQLVAGYSENTDPVFNVTVEYRLDGPDFLVSIPYQEIRYRAEYPITGITVLPMFGATSTDEEGFMMVPEGGGALIRYNNGKLSQNSYYANVYGWDYGSERTELVSETKVSFPVFGMTSKGGSFLCMLEGATSYAGIQADISMRYNSYNWACAKYTVLHADRYNVSAKTARLVYMFEKELPQDTIIQRYRFIDSDDYVVMANTYGDYLRARYPELTKTDASEEMPVSVELVGAIDKRVVRMGMPTDAVIAVTTFDQAGDIIDDLKGEGVKNLNVRFSGWCNGGVRQRVLTSVHVEGSLGGAGGMKKLIGRAKDAGVPLYFDGMSAFAYDSGILNGFIPYNDAARFTTREQIAIYPYSKITYQPDESRKAYYLVHPKYSERMLNNLTGDLKNRGAYGVAFRDVGLLLSGEYNPKDTTTREQVRAMHVGVVEKAKADGQAVMVKEGFDYVMPYADIITDMDLDGIEYSILDTKVPFYQIAIHGSVDYTGGAINLENDWQTELLRCAEYGAGLNFTFMAEDAQIVQDTYYGSYYGAYYSAWRDEAVELVTGYQTAMKGLNRTRITGHQVLQKGVTRTDYANGARVYVNYTMEDARADGQTIPARSYIVAGGEQ